MRFFVILSISFFFLFGKGYAHIHGQSAASASQVLHTNTKQPDFGNSGSSPWSVIKTIPHKSQKIKLLTLEFEEDDDDTESFKKNFTLPNQCLICFYAQAPPATTFLPTYSLPSCAHFSYSASFRYLTHLRLRI